MGILFLSIVQSDSHCLENTRILQSCGKSPVFAFKEAFFVERRAVLFVVIEGFCSVLRILVASVKIYSCRQMARSS